MNAGFRLVDEQPDFVVLDKAAGQSFHSDDGAGLVVKAEAALGYPLFAVHRLDKVTSGLIILARSSAAAAALTQSFTQHQIEKYYLALAKSKPAKKQGWVKGDMVPARRGAWKLLPTQTNPAVSYFFSQGFAELDFRAFLIKPFSGKTHQIRVALKSVGAPILGDALYQGSDADRVYLHAYALRFNWQGTETQYVLPPQQGAHFNVLAQQAVMAEWAKPWQLTWPGYSIRPAVQQQSSE